MTLQDALMHVAQIGVILTWITIQYPLKCTIARRHNPIVTIQLLINSYQVLIIILLSVTKPLLDFVLLYFNRHIGQTKQVLRHISKATIVECIIYDSTVMLSVIITYSALRVLLNYSTYFVSQIETLY